MLLNTINVEVVNFDNMNELLYVEDTDVAKAWKSCNEPWTMIRTPYFHFHIQEGFLPTHNKLCIPQSFLD